MKPRRCEVCLRPKVRTRFSTDRRLGCPDHLDYDGEEVRPCDRHGRDHLKLIWRPGMGMHYGCAMCYRSS